jgi:hypothetical protein
MPRAAVRIHGVAGKPLKMGELAADRNFTNFVNGELEFSVSRETRKFLFHVKHFSFQPTSY